MRQEMGKASVVGVLVLFIISAPLARVALRNLPNPKVKVDVPAATFFLSILQHAICRSSWTAIRRLTFAQHARDVGNASVVAVLVFFLKHQESQLGAQLGNASVVAVLVRFPSTSDRQNIEMHLSWRFWCEFSSTSDRQNIEMHLSWGFWWDSSSMSDR